MARVLCPALSLDAVGNLGAINYYHHGRTKCARAACKPVQPGTEDQWRYWTRMKDASQRWGEITADQRQKWYETSLQIQRSDSFGQQRSIRPYNLFISWNMCNQLGGGTIQDEPTGRQQILVGGLEVANIQANSAGVRMTSGKSTLPAWKCIFYLSIGYTSEARHATLREFNLYGMASSDEYRAISGLTPSTWYWVMVRPLESCGQLRERYYIQFKTLATP